MQKIKNLIKKIIFKFIKPVTLANSYSQAGEDRIIEHLFKSMGINQIYYLDIGANDPISSNNTYSSYLKGNTGVLIEPDLDLYEIIKKTRPNDLVIQAAISNEENKEADFYIFNLSALNTLSKEEADLRSQSGSYKLIAIRKIKLITIENIIQNHFNSLPQLISLDVEGIDFKVLNSFNFEKYPVPVWIVETCEYSENHIKPKVSVIIDLMLSKGYFVFADTYINTIFVNKVWFENYKAI